MEKIKLTRGGNLVSYILPSKIKKKSVPQKKVENHGLLTGRYCMYYRSYHRFVCCNAVYNFEIH